MEKLIIFVVPGCKAPFEKNPEKYLAATSEK
jgi:YHS domain-containing protein